MRTLFLQAPSYDGFDGGAGARYQMRREVRSFWYPTWLAQPAALVPNSKLIDAPPHRLGFADVAPYARQYELLVLHTSSPSFVSDVKTAEAMKELNPELRSASSAPRSPSSRRKAWKRRGRLISLPAASSTTPSKKSLKDMTGARSSGLSYRNADGVIVHNEDRPILEDMDALPFVTPVYKRDLVIENYFGGYLQAILTFPSIRAAAANRAAPSVFGRRRSAAIAIACAAWAML